MTRNRDGEWTRSSGAAIRCRRQTTEQGLRHRVATLQLTSTDTQWIPVSAEPRLVVSPRPSWCGTQPTLRTRSVALLPPSFGRERHSSFVVAMAVFCFAFFFFFKQKTAYEMPK